MLTSGVEFSLVLEVHSPAPGKMYMLPVQGLHNGIEEKFMVSKSCTKCLKGL